MADGQPANAEDLIISQALQVPYQNQHPDVQRLVGQRVEERLHDLPHTLAVARRYADRAIAAAHERSTHVGIAIVDELGQMMQMDRMDGAAPMSPDMAEAKALTALNFQRPTDEVEERFAAERLVRIQEIVHFKVLAAGGGVPIVIDGAVVGAIGVSGSGSDAVNAEIARAAVEQVKAELLL